VNIPPGPVEVPAPTSDPVVRIMEDRTWALQKMMDAEIDALLKKRWRR
jgi:hypothetical protein